jgi:hypothetical protein
MFLQEPSQIRILCAVSEIQNLIFFGEACSRTIVDLHLTIYEIASPTKYICGVKFIKQPSSMNSLPFVVKLVQLHHFLSLT